jgi:hypothetical protein
VQDQRHVNVGLSRLPTRTLFLSFVTYINAHRDHAAGDVGLALALASAGVRALSVRPQYGFVDQKAGLAQPRDLADRQRDFLHRTVNPLAYAFVGSSPTSPTTLKQQRISPASSFDRDPISFAPVAILCPAFSSTYIGCRRLYANMRATADRYCSLRPRGGYLPISSLAAGFENQSGRI